jgi:hypothetical protein
MTSSPEPVESAISTDLVEYLLVVLPGPMALAAVGAELVRIVDTATVRILDVVVVNVGEDGTPDVLDIESLGVASEIREMTACYGVLLSRHDIELVALALQPGDCAVVLVAEDRWAEPLATAARSVGGEVRAGERIARQRVEAALARVDRDRKGGS